MHMTFAMTLLTKYLSQQSNINSLTLFEEKLPLFEGGAASALRACQGNDAVKIVLNG
jgi:hypothetical protein